MKPETKLQVTMDLDTAKTILEAAFFYHDEGPEGEGWKSEKLESACKQMCHNIADAIAASGGDPEPFIREYSFYFR